MQKYVFLVVAALMAGASIRIVTTKNLVHGALYLVVALGGVAIVFLVLTAEFIAWVQILIYVGAVIVLLLFGLMLTRAPIGATALDNEQRGLALLVSGALFAVMAIILWTAFPTETIAVRPQIFTTEALGRQILTRFVLPFEVVSVVLLAALVGAVVLAKRDEGQDELIARDTEEHSDAG